MASTVLTVASSVAMSCIARKVRIAQIIGNTAVMGNLAPTGLVKKA